MFSWLQISVEILQGLMQCLAHPPFSGEVLCKLFSLSMLKPQVLVGKYG